MKAYWDSSALVQSHLDNDLHARLRHEGAYTRTHSLSETFATLTGRAAIAMPANDAAAAIKGLLQYLDLVDLTELKLPRRLPKQNLWVCGADVSTITSMPLLRKSQVQKPSLPWTKMTLPAWSATCPWNSFNILPADLLPGSRAQKSSNLGCCPRRIPSCSTTNSC